MESKINIGLEYVKVGEPREGRILNMNGNQAIRGRNTI